MTTAFRAIASARMREATIMAGRWTGANTSALSKVSGTGRGITFTRTGVGTFDVTLDDPMPSIQYANFAVHSANTANVRVATVTPYASSKWVVKVIDAVSTNAVDLASTEEMQAFVIGAFTGVP